MGGGVGQFTRSKGGGVGQFTRSKTVTWVEEWVSLLEVKQ